MVSIRLYAGKSAYLTVLVSVGVQLYTHDMSDNLFSAGNQQERLIKIGWVAGFVDGEGCFSIGFVRQPDRNHRKGYRTGYQVSHNFAVVQGARSKYVLEQLQQFFGVGKVYINRRYDNHKEHLYRYNVYDRNDLLNVIIPFFRKYPMRTAKQQDFEVFAHCVEMMSKNHHLTKGGIVEIAKLVQTMNRQKPRESLISILRDHTPKIRDTGS